VREILSTETYLPIKLIATQDSEITNSTIRATNRQTEVKEEAFEALAEFHKGLEEFYNSQVTDDVSDYRLRYERRSGQYRYDDGVIPADIISMPIHLQCYVAMFLGQPHGTHRYYGNILVQHRGDVFHRTHSLWPYYTAGLSLKVLDTLIVRGIVDRRVKGLRYQMLFLMRCAMGDSPAPTDDRKMRGFCLDLIAILRNPRRAETLFAAFAAALLAELDATGTQRHRGGWDASRRRDFTARLEREATNIRALVDPEVA